MDYIEEQEIENLILDDSIKQIDELEELQQRIDKSIEYLKDNACYEEDTNIFCDDLRNDNCKDLLDILKGEYEKN